MQIVLNWEAFVSPLIEMAASRAMVRVMTPDVRRAEPSHVFGQIRIAARSNHQMPMVGHETKSKQIDRCSFPRLYEELTKRIIITRLVKDAHAAIAAIQNVINSSAFHSAGRSGHRGNLLGIT